MGTPTYCPLVGSAGVLDLQVAPEMTWGSLVGLSPYPVGLCRLRVISVTVHYRTPASAHRRPERCLV